MNTLSLQMTVHFVAGGVLDNSAENHVKSWNIYCCLTERSMLLSVDHGIIAAALAVTGHGKGYFHARLCLDVSLPGCG